MKKSDRKLIRRYRVDDGGKFRLKEHDPADTAGLVLDKDEARRLLGVGVESLAELQGKLYAEDRWALLVIFQAMDAAGKDGTIGHVMSGVNPQGCEVFSFKEPSPEELDHDFLWRASQRLPERGRIGIFNRSHYEEVLIVRVHSEILAGEKIPDALVTKRIWDERYEDINAFERHLARNGTAILKFFLNVSKKEQKKRFLARLDDPEKKWKFNLADVQERALWGDYMDAYEEMIRATSTEWAPWYVVPADQKWFTRIVVAGAIVDTLERLGVDYPKVDPAAKRRLAQARRELQKN
ncbi:MAG TPA: polyphosphate kinase 2 family protein [Thermoanaerobaculia bacterium]|nr:polyphosphate kinase 2 family protein [Thermoanaerobaculia bacterium]